MTLRDVSKMLPGMSWQYDKVDHHYEAAPIAGHICHLRCVEFSELHGYHLYKVVITKESTAIYDSGKTLPYPYAMKLAYISLRYILYRIAAPEAMAMMAEHPSFECLIEEAKSIPHELLDSECVSFCTLYAEIWQGPTLIDTKALYSHSIDGIIHEAQRLEHEYIERVSMYQLIVRVVSR